MSADEPRRRSARQAATDASALDRLYRRPGFLIRRAHQIAVSIFLEESAALGITTTQYGALTVLRARADLDQVGLSILVGIDRSTTALVVAKLEADGYVTRARDPADRRRKLLVLTPAGHDVLDRAAGPAQRTRDRELAVFSDAEAEQFLHLLERFVGAFNAATRAPIRAEGERRAGASDRVGLTAGRGVGEGG